MKRHELRSEPALSSQRTADEWPIQLTTAQHETLTTALNMGYYNVSRDTTMDELAGTLGVSQQALSKRFRRGYRNLIEDSLTVSPPDEGEW